ncbi:MAG: hypothetical protein ACKO96_05600, partial [Flammeovirgaceae bacterium]
MIEAKSWLPHMGLRPELKKARLDSNRKSNKSGWIDLLVDFELNKKDRWIDLRTPNRKEKTK